MYCFIIFETFTSFSGWIWTSFSGRGHATAAAAAVASEAVRAVDTEVKEAKAGEVTETEAGDVDASEEAEKEEPESEDEEEEDGDDNEEKEIEEEVGVDDVFDGELGDWESDEDGREAAEEVDDVKRDEVEEGESIVSAADKDCFLSVVFASKDVTWIVFPSAETTSFAVFKTDACVSTAFVVASAFASATFPCVTFPSAIPVVPGLIAFFPSAPCEPGGATRVGSSSS